MSALFLDDRETRDPIEREAALIASLPTFLAHAKAGSRAHAERLGNIDPGDIDSREALARLPVLRKSDLLAQQRASLKERADPFGGYSASGWRSLGLTRTAKRVYQSPGPIYEPQGQALDSWRMARSLYAAGFRAGDLVHNSFSYHLTPAGAMMEEGALAIGCTVFPAGVGNTDLQLQAMQELQPDCYCGTPSFLKLALERAGQEPSDLASLRRAVVSGEACPPSLREWFSKHDVDVYQAYATADVGLIAYETSAREGLVVDEQVLVEIVGPDGYPVPEGEIGEVVVTTFDIDYPLVRFGTGDLSALLPGHCPTGRSNVRIRGWLGRADQTTKVRGMFVHPSQIDEIGRRLPELGRLRLVVTGEVAAERMVLQAECEFASDDLLRRALDTIRDVTKLRGEVDWREVGSLPNDGKRIEDLRSYK